MIAKTNNPTFNAIASYKKSDFYSQFVLRMISDKYVSIMVIYWPWNVYDISGGNSRRSMLSFNNYKSVSINKGMK